MFMEKITTKDGSETFRNEEFDETYHSISGAKEESVKKFAEPCLIGEKSKSGEIVILDFCFGLGYNSCAAIDASLEINKDCNILIIGLENDSEILSKIKELNPNFQNYSIIKEVAKNKKYESDKLNIYLIYGDAKIVIKKLPYKFDAVFFDPFSPKKCPELWTEEVFKDVFKLMKKNSILSTYSCARIVRENMKKAGFVVKDGPVVGRRSPCTVCIR